MRVVKLTFLLAAMAFGASAANINGTWRAVFVNGDEPKSVGEVILYLNWNGERLTGTAYVGFYIPKAPIVHGKVDGDRVVFTVYSNSPSGATWASGEEASWLPKLAFVGTVRGDEIQFTMSSGSVMLYGKPPVGRDWVLRATRKAD